MCRKEGNHGVDVYFILGRQKNKKRQMLRMIRRYRCVSVEVPPRVRLFTVYLETTNHSEPGRTDGQDEIDRYRVFPLNTIIINTVLCRCVHGQYVTL